MYERWTDRARRVAVLAGEEARMARRPAIGCEHLLLAMIREGECVAARALDKLGITRESVIKAAGPYQAAAGSQGHIPFTPEAKKIIREYGLREALLLGHNFVGTEHILLALVRREGSATDLMARCGVSGLQVRGTVLNLLHGYESAGGTGAPAAEPESVPHLLAERRRLLAAVESGDKLIRDILVALCERDGLALDSGADPGSPARNYELAMRLRIGHVFGIADPDGEGRD